MVTAYRAAQASSNRDNQHFIGIAGTENVANNRNQNREGTPACTGRERKEHSYNKDNCRQEHFQDTCGVCNNIMHIELRTQKTGHTGQSPSHGQNHNRRNHCSEACRNTLSKFLKGHYVAYHVEAECKEEGCHAAEHQAFRSISTCKSINKGFACKETTAINHTDNAADNKYNYRQYKVNNRTVRLIGIVIIITIRTSSSSKQVALIRIILVNLHATEIKFHDGQKKHHR